MKRFASKFLLLAVAALSALIPSVARATEGDVTVPATMEPSAVAGTALTKVAPYLVTVITILLLAVGIRAVLRLIKRVLGAR